MLFSNLVGEKGPRIPGFTSGYARQARGQGFQGLFSKDFISAFIVVVKKTFRYENVFFYNHLYRNSIFRNIFTESGITFYFYRMDNLGEIINLKSL